MVKKIFILIFVTLVSLPSFAEEGPQSFHLFLGVGNNFSTPGTVRFGYKAWEYGMIYNIFYGASKSFYFHRFFYTSFGLGVSTHAAIQAAAGAKFPLFWGFGARMELGAFMAANAFSQQQGAVGITYTWGD